MDATHVICHPQSSDDGKRVRIVSGPEHGYNQQTGAYDPGFVEVEVIATGRVGWIHKRFLSEIQ